MVNGDDEVKRENAQPDPVSTTASFSSLVLLTVDLQYNGGHGAGQRLGFRTLVIGVMG